MTNIKLTSEQTRKEYYQSTCRNCNYIRITKKGYKCYLAQPHLDTQDLGQILTEPLNFKPDGMQICVYFNKKKKIDKFIKEENNN